MTKYTKKLAETICDLVGNGQSLEEICKAKNMPTPQTIRYWNRNMEGFSTIYARAREDQGSYYGEKVNTISNDCLKGEVKPDVARVAMDGFKWTAARMNRAIYGDKMQVDSHITGDLTVFNLDKAKTRSSKRKKPKN